MQRTSMKRTLSERLWAGAVWTVVVFFVVNLFAMIAAVITSSFATRWLRSWLPSGWTTRCTVPPGTSSSSATC